MVIDVPFKLYVTFFKKFSKPNFEYPWNSMKNSSIFIPAVVTMSSSAWMLFTFQEYWVHNYDFSINKDGSSNAFSLLIALGVDKSTNFATVLSLWIFSIFSIPVEISSWFQSTFSCETFIVARIEEKIYKFLKYLKVALMF